MKITKQLLREAIEEEVKNILNEQRQPDFTVAEHPEIAKMFHENALKAGYRYLSRTGVRGGTQGKAYIYEKLEEKTGRKRYLKYVEGFAYPGKTIP